MSDDAKDKAEPPDYPDDDPEEIDQDDEWVEAEINCGMMRDGQCGQAGSEYCEFSCPFRH